MRSPDSFLDHERYKRGYVPMDTPPGLEEREYAEWKKAGGQVDADVPADWSGCRPYGGEQEKESGGRRRTDPELKAVDQILAILEGLDLGAERRVLVYLSDRFKAGA